jgi:hypothetical protein
MQKSKNSDLLVLVILGVSIVGILFCSWDMPDRKGVALRAICGALSSCAVLLAAKLD